MIIKNPTQIKTLPDEMYLENQQAVNEYKLGSDDPFQGVCFPHDPRYDVNIDLCDSDLEIRNEKYASKVCQKYGLEYVQGKGVCGSNEITDVLKAAREEIKEKMPVSEIYWLDEPDDCYFFTFDSWKQIKL